MTAAGAKIYIISKNPFQSQLLARFLHLETGVSCTVCSPSDENPVIEDNENHFSLILWDCGNYGPDSLRSKPVIRRNCRAQNRCVALFNAGRDSGVEYEAISLGVRGVFFHDTETRFFAMGVKAILNGEWWYSRECLAVYLAADSRIGANPSDGADPLTNREKEILMKLASGFTLSQIAAELSISPHTVKTHTRNIYKKLGVSSRFEAIRLAPNYI